MLNQCGLEHDLNAGLGFKHTTIYTSIPKTCLISIPMPNEITATPSEIKAISTNRFLKDIAFATEI